MRETAKMPLRFKWNVHLPMVPNFLRVEGSDATIPIADVTDDELRRIGALWTEELVRIAQSRRNAGRKGE